MGVDITHIIRHDFRDVSNKEAALEYTKKAVDRLKKICICMEQMTFLRLLRISTALPLGFLSMMLRCLCIMDFGKWSHSITTAR